MCVYMCVYIYVSVYMYINVTLMENNFLKQINLYLKNKVDNTVQRIETY